MIYFQQGREPASWLWAAKKVTVPRGCLMGTWLLVGGSPATPPAKGDEGRNLATHNISGK